MRLIDAEKIKIPTSTIHNINGCYMVRVEDVQRIISDQPTAFNKEKVIEEMKNIGQSFCVSVKCPEDCQDCEHGVTMKALIEIVEKGGV